MAEFRLAVSSWIIDSATGGLNRKFCLVQQPLPAHSKSVEGISSRAPSRCAERFQFIKGFMTISRRPIPPNSSLASIKSELDLFLKIQADPEPHLNKLWDDLEQFGNHVWTELRETLRTGGAALSLPAKPILLLFCGENPATALKIMGRTILDNRPPGASCITEIFRVFHRSGLRVDAA